MDYISIPLQLAPHTAQDIYVRKQLKFNNDQDSDSESEDDSVRTLFVTNLPLDTTEDNIKDICNAMGGVVLNEFVRQGTRHGLISLMDSNAAARFLSKAKKLSDKKSKKAVQWEQYGPRGAEGYLAHHYAKYPEEWELQQKVDEYMELFAEQEQRDLEEAERAAEEVDEDGFRLVINKNRKRLSDIPDSQSVPEPKRKKKSLEKSDFYRFQLRERRKQEMSDLLKRYQEDKEKVEELKKRKAYTPF